MKRDAHVLKPHEGASLRRLDPWESHDSNEGGAYVHSEEASRRARARQDDFAEFRAPAPERAEGERLVSSKTSRQSRVLGDSLCIGFGKSEQAEKRVRRLKRSVWASGHLHGLAVLRGHRPPVAWFVTLTYAQADAWEPDHISTAFERYRNWCKRAGVACRYTWVAEIQPERCKRTGKAVVHYHALCWLPVGIEMPSWGRKPSRRHERFWQHGRSEAEVARAGVGYLMKYLSKLGEFHRFPKGLRLYGIGGLVKQGREVRSWLNLPEWAKRLHGVGELVRAGSRLCIAATGEILSSPYLVRLVPGGLVLKLVRPIAERFHDGAYSTWRVA